MSALPQEKPLPCQAFDDDPQVLAEVLREGVNLAVWTRRLSPALRDFAAALVRNRPGLALSQTLEMEEERLPVLDGLLDAQQLPGQTDFLDDLGWLVEAFSCLTGARRIGLRLRVLDVYKRQVPPPGRWNGSKPRRRECAGGRLPEYVRRSVVASAPGWLRSAACLRNGSAAGSERWRTGAPGSAGRPPACRRWRRP